MANWQPIETAPKDGSIVVIAQDNYVRWPGIAVDSDFEMRHAYWVENRSYTGGGYWAHAKGRNKKRPVWFRADKWKPAK